MADNVLCKDYNEAFKEIKFNKNNYFVIVTRGYKDDRKCLDNMVVYFLVLFNKKLEVI